MTRRRDLGQRCTGLLVALLLLPVLMFSLSEGPVAGLIAAAAITSVLLGGIHAVSGSRKQLLIGVILMLPAVCVRWLVISFGIESSSLLLQPALYDLLPFSYFVYVLGQYVFLGGKVTMDQLRGAACIYLLLGLLWANVYLIVARLAPDAFRYGAMGTEHFMGAYRELVYFSYVTLSTLGYGDTVPVIPQAKALALLESVSGVLFVGILVARLAGALHITAATSEDDADA
jgi:hypothetical protein